MHKTSPRTDQRAPSPQCLALRTASIPEALRNFDALPDAAHVRLPVLCALFGISPATAWRWVKKSVLPPPRKLSEAVTAWNVGELRKALNGESWK